MKISRKLQSTIENKCFKGKVIILTGPRQVGKSTLLHGICTKLGKYLYLDGDDPSVRASLDSPNFEQLKFLIGKYKLVLIDEAQRINNIGLSIKMIQDRIKDVQVMVSGSSALDIGNHLQESLTGRKWEFNMFPISWEEWLENNDYLTVSSQLENRIIYGMYPDVINNNGEEEKILNEISKSNLYKDILSLTGIKKPDKLEKLVMALALQIGNEVSYNELSQLLGIDKNTVATYIELLEKSFVVYRVKPYNQNERNIIKSNNKIYFYDTGLRNAIINNFNPLNMRNDKGALWENFVFNERIKYNNYHQNNIKTYFWRAINGGEIDLVEQKNNELMAYEIKWSTTKIVKLPAAFKKLYNAEFTVINPENFIKFVADV